METSTNHSPSKARSFWITSRCRWSGFNSKKPSDTCSRSSKADTGNRNISIFSSVVDVSRLKIGSSRPGENNYNIILPEYSVRSTTSVNRDTITPLRPKALLRNGPSVKHTNSSTGIRQKFFGSSGSRTTNKSTLLEICSSLAQIPAGEISKPETTQSERFQLSPIKFRIKTLGNKKFKILIPSTEVNSGFSVANHEEQGDSGICDRFIGMLPESCWDISQRASPLGFVTRLLPRGKVGESVRYIGYCFWIWLCVVDDLTENLVGKDWEETESDLMQIFTNSVSEGRYYNAESDAFKVSRALRSVIDTTDIQDNNSRVVDSSWRDAFRSTVREVLTGFQAERPLLETKKIALSDWMRVRVVTISARPFMILAKASLGIDLMLSASGNPLIGDYIALSPDRGCDTNLEKVECILQLVMGLQNDILGWEKDFKVNNNLNAIQILAQDGMNPCIAMKTVIGAHNKLVQHLSNYGERAWVDSLSTGRSLIADSTSTQTPHWINILGSCYSAASLRPDQRRDSFMSQRRHSIPDDNVRNYLELVIGFASGMANWMLVSKRYVA